MLIKKFIKVPKIIQLNLYKNNKKNTYINIKGPLGSLNFYINPNINILVKNEFIVIIGKKDSINIINTYKKLLINSTKDLIKPFKKTLILKGTGFNATLENQNQLVLNLGYSSTITLTIPQNILIQLKNKQKTIIISGKNRNIITTFAKIIKQQKLPDVYKGQGILYLNETLNLKTGKQN